MEFGALVSMSTIRTQNYILCGILHHEDLIQSYVLGILQIFVAQ